jgi:hypothetical protein
VRIEAIETLVCHAVVSGDVYSLNDLGDHILVLAGQARRFLAVAA